MRNVHVCFILSSSWCWIKKNEKKTFHKVLMYVEISLHINTGRLPNYAWGNCRDAITARASRYKT